MSFYQQVFLSKYLFIKMSFYQNVFLSKCLFIKMSFSRNILCENVLRDEVLIDIYLFGVEFLYRSGF